MTRRYSATQEWNRAFRKLPTGNHSLVIQREPKESAIFFMRGFTTDITFHGEHGYEEYKGIEIPDTAMRFHATWRRLQDRNKYQMFISGDDGIKPWTGGNAWSNGDVCWGQGNRVPFDPCRAWDLFWNSSFNKDLVELPDLDLLSYDEWVDLYAEYEHLPELMELPDCVRRAGARGPINGLDWEELYVALNPGAPFTHVYRERHRLRRLLNAWNDRINLCTRKARNCETTAASLFNDPSFTRICRRLDKKWKSKNVFGPWYEDQDGVMRRDYLPSLRARNILKTYDRSTCMMKARDRTMKWSTLRSKGGALVTRHLKTYDDICHAVQVHYQVWYAYFENHLGYGREISCARDMLCDGQRPYKRLFRFGTRMQPSQDLSAVRRTFRVLNRWMMVAAQHTLCDHRRILERAWRDYQDTEYENRYTNLWKKEIYLDIGAYYRPVKEMGTKYEVYESGASGVLDASSAESSEVVGLYEIKYKGDVPDDYPGANCPSCGCPPSDRQWHLDDRYDGYAYWTCRRDLGNGGVCLRTTSTSMHQTTPLFLPCWKGEGSDLFTIMDGVLYKGVRIGRTASSKGTHPAYCWGAFEVETACVSTQPTSLEQEEQEDSSSQISLGS